MNSITKRILATASTQMQPVSELLGIQPITGSYCRLKFRVLNGGSCSVAALSTAANSLLCEGLVSVPGSFRVEAASRNSGDVRIVNGIVGRGMAVRHENLAQAKTRYSTIAKNVMMDSEDEKVWTVQARDNGTLVLTREVDEDMGTLVAMARSQHGVIRSSIAENFSVPAMGSYVAFANPINGAIDYGYSVGADSEGNALIVSRRTGDLVVAHAGLVVDSYNIHADDSELQIHASLRQAGVKIPMVLRNQLTALSAKLGRNVKQAALARLADTTETPLDPASIPYDDMRAYYKQMYAYAPEYYKEFERMIDESGF